MDDPRASRTRPPSVSVPSPASAGGRCPSTLRLTLSRPFLGVPGWGLLGSGCGIQVRGPVGEGPAPDGQRDAVWRGEVCGPRAPLTQRSARMAVRREEAQGSQTSLGSGCTPCRGRGSSDGAPMPCHPPSAVALAQLPLQLLVRGSLPGSRLAHACFLLPAKAPISNRGRGRRGDDARVQGLRGLSPPHPSPRVHSKTSDSRYPTPVLILLQRPGVRTAPGPKEVNPRPLHFTAWSGF